MIHKSSSSDDAGTVFRDVLFLTLAGFVALLIIILPHINPPGQKKAIDIAQPGNVIIELYWEDKASHDVDLWVRGPGDNPVGFSNQGGVVFNLLRDDLGSRNDHTERNYENAISRGIVPGIYTVNANLFRMSGTKYMPLKILVVVSVKLNASAASRQILKTTAFLRRPGHQITLFNFELTKDGKLVKGSVNDRFIPLTFGAFNGIDMR